MNTPENQCCYAINTQNMENFFEGNMPTFVYVFIFFIAKRYIKWASKSAYAEYDTHFIYDYSEGYLTKTKILPIFPAAFSIRCLTNFLRVCGVCRIAQFKYM